MYKFLRLVERCSLDEDFEEMATTKRRFYGEKVSSPTGIFFYISHEFASILLFGVVLLV